MAASIPKRLLFGVLWPGLGGHVRSAVALATALRRRGHVVDFVADRTAGPATLIDEAGFRVHRVEYAEGDLLLRGLGRSLRALVRDHRYDAIHWFERSSAPFVAARAAAEAGCAFVWTVASGGPPPAYHGLNRVAVFTNEVADDVRRRSPGTQPHVLPARLEIGDLDAAFAERARREVRTRLGLGPDDRLVVRVARCAPIYVESIRLGVGLAARLNASGCRTAFLHAGYVQDEAAAREIQAAIDAANRDQGSGFASSETKDVARAARYLAAADLCLASGRSALEAIALARSTLIVWGSRYMGLVNDESIDDLAATNFQGWAQPDPGVGEDIMLGRMVDDARRVLADPDRAATALQACARLVRDRYSVERAADAYALLYADRTVTTESLLRHYSQAVHLGSEVRRWASARYRRLTRRPLT